MPVFPGGAHYEGVNAVSLDIEPAKFLGMSGRRNAQCDSRERRRRNTAANLKFLHCGSLGSFGEEFRAPYPVPTTVGIIPGQLPKVTGERTGLGLSAVWPTAFKWLH